MSVASGAEVWLMYQIFGYVLFISVIFLLKWFQFAVGVFCSSLSGAEHIKPSVWLGVWSDFMPSFGIWSKLNKLKGHSSDRRRACPCLSKSFFQTLNIKCHKISFCNCHLGFIMLVGIQNYFSDSPAKVDGKIHCQEYIFVTVKKHIGYNFSI